MHNLYLAYRLASEFRDNDWKERSLDEKHKILQAIKNSSLIKKICEDYELGNLEGQLDISQKKKTFVLRRMCMLLTDINVDIESNPYMKPKNFWERYRVLKFLCEGYNIQVSF